MKQMDLRCPACKLPLSREDDSLSCGQHTFAVAGDVPVLLPGGGAGIDISKSFSREWAYFRHDQDRSWGATVAQRVDEFKRHVGLERLDGLQVLDAGCGNGSLSNGLTSLGGNITACDISAAVHEAARHYPAINFLQVDLMQHPFPPSSFDVVYCAGVVHHTPDSRVTFNRVAETVAQDGRMFVWVYWRRPGWKYTARTTVRTHVAKLPESFRHRFAIAAGAEKALRSSITRRHSLNWREHMIAAHDFYTPRWRWEHTPDEVHGWFNALGFSPQTTETGRDGFGVLGIRR